MGIQLASCPQYSKSGSSGCSLALMSPYSSVFRESLWGGIPISLGGMAVFAFLLFRGIMLLIRRRYEVPGLWRTVFLVSLVPVLTSVVMGTVNNRVSTPPVPVKPLKKLPRY